MTPGTVPLVDSRSMSNIDRAAQELFHIPGVVLMENAGAGAWRNLSDRIDRDRIDRGRMRSVLFVAGRGNNGGDALVMARHCLVEGRHRPEVLISSDALREPGAEHLRSCVALGIPVFDWSRDRENAERAIERCDWIVDGIAGTGLDGKLSADMSALVGAVNRSGHPVAAIDCPTGIGDQFQSDYPSIHARVTLTMGLPKRSLYYRTARPRCGDIEVVPVGFPPSLLEDAGCGWNLIDDEALSSLLVPIGRATYKNRRGVVAVFAGAAGTSGAAVLCSEAAGRSGAGLVRLHVDPNVHPTVAPQVTSVMAVPTGVTDVVDLGKSSALIIGPGWGTEAHRDRQLTALLESGLPGVVDADGITVVSRLHTGGTLPPMGGRWVLTPHLGEFATLCGTTTDAIPEDPSAMLLEWSSRLEAVIVLKGHVPWISTPWGTVSVVDGMTPALGTGGSGDVLAGIIGAQLARGASARHAAEAGVLLHQMVGRLLFDSAGFFLAEDLLVPLSKITADYVRIDD